MRPSTRCSSSTGEAEAARIAEATAPADEAIGCGGLAGRRVPEASQEHGEGPVPTAAVAAYLGGRGGERWRGIGEREGVERGGLGVGGGDGWSWRWRRSIAWDWASEVTRAGAGKRLLTPKSSSN